MANAKDGGHAFPPGIAVDHAGDAYHGPYGMSLRDWFAGKVVGAMTRIVITADPQALARAAAVEGFDGDVDDFVAIKAYKIADAMLRARV